MSYEIYKSVKQNADGTFDCVCSPNKDFEDEKNGLINHALKFVGKSAKNPSEDDIAKANDYITEKEYQYEPSEEYKHLGY